MTVLDVLKALSILMMMGYVLDMQWTFYKMEPSTINKIYQPLIQKPEVDETYINTRISTTDLDINLKNSHLLNNLENCEELSRSNTMEGFYKKTLTNFLSLTSFDSDDIHSLSDKMSHPNDVTRLSVQRIGKQEEEEQKYDKEQKKDIKPTNFFKFIWDSLTYPLCLKSPKTMAMDLSMLEDRFREDLIKVEQKTEELKARQRELYKYLKSEENKSDDQRNFVLDQLVESELEKLDFLEWKLSALRRRLTKTARFLDKKTEHSLD